MIVRIIRPAVVQLCEGTELDVPRELGQSLVSGGDAVVMENEVADENTEYIEHRCD